MNTAESSGPRGLEPDDCVLAPAMLSIRLTRHAIERYQERVRPGLDLAAAALELERLLPLGRITSRAPAWLARNQHQRAAYYLTIGDVVVPLDPCRRDRESLIGLTCLARGCLSPAARRRRRARRQPEELAVAA